MKPPMQEITLTNGTVFQRVTVPFEYLHGTYSRTGHHYFYNNWTGQVWGSICGTAPFHSYRPRTVKTLWWYPLDLWSVMNVQLLKLEIAAACDPDWGSIVPPGVARPS